LNEFFLIGQKEKVKQEVLQLKLALFGLSGKKRKEVGYIN
jgi:hypothetical protein